MKDFLSYKNNPAQVRQATEKATFENLKTSQIGRIVSMSSDGFDVDLITKIKLDQSIQYSPTRIKCLVASGYNNTGGCKTIYEVNDYVVVLFLDYSISSYTKGAFNTIREPKKETKPHSLNNGIIIGKIDRSNVIENEQGFFYKESTISIDKETKKLILKKQNETLKAINNDLIDKIKELKDLIKGLQTPPLVGGGFINATTLDGVDFDSIKTRINDLFL